MFLTVLGVSGPFPAVGGACSGYLLESDSGKTKILLDCGTGALSRLLEHTTVEELSGVVLSHLHFDHMSDMLPMQYALQFSNRPHALPVMAPMCPERVRTLLISPHTDLFPHNDMAIGEMRISFIPAVHPVEGSCVSIEYDGAHLVFTGDTNENPALELFADQCDLLLADAGFLRENWTPKAPHLSAALCGELARSARVKALLLTHLNPKNNPEALLLEAREAYPRAEIAEPGRRYRI